MPKGQGVHELQLQLDNLANEILGLRMVVEAHERRIEHLETELTANKELATTTQAAVETYLANPLDSAWMTFGFAPHFRAVNTLKQWTHKTKFDVVYDSALDGAQHTTFVERVVGSSCVMFVVVDRKGNAFGGYVTATITGTDRWIVGEDHFVFSLHTSRRLEPRRYLKQSKTRDAAAYVYGASDECWFDIGCGSFIRVGAAGSRWNYCHKLSWGYRCVDDDAVSGTAWPATFDPARVVVLQFA